MPASPSTVLLVERDPHVTALTTHFLVAAGHVVEVAADGEDALARVRRRVPDLVITEILVPKLDGLAICRELKANPETRAVPIIVLSILAAGTRAKEAGADGFLLKPIAEHRLIAMVQSLVAERSPLPQPTQERT